MSGKSLKKVLANKGTRRSMASAKKKASLNRNKTIKRVKSIYLASKAMNKANPMLTRTNQGYAYFTQKTPIDQERLAKLYHERILYNASVKDARNGIYTWIMKGSQEAFLGSQPDLDPTAYTLYAVRTCTQQEIGTIHQNLNVLTEAYSNDPREIVAAGELEVRDGAIRFNLLSGTYMYKQRLALMKVFAANQASMMRRLEKRANKRTNANEKAIDAMEKTMFEEIAQRTMVVMAGKGLDRVTFLASEESAGGTNLIKHGAFRQEPENDPILCTYFDRVIVRPLSPVVSSIVASDAAASNQLSI